MTKIRYHGHIISEEGLKPNDDEKARTIMQMPPPKNKQALMRFMGMVQYLSKFILNLFDISAPLQKLLEDDVQWHWEDEHQKKLHKNENSANKCTNTEIL